MSLKIFKEKGITLVRDLFDMIDSLFVIGELF